MHWQRLIMHICCNPPLCHPGDKVVSVFLIHVKDSYKKQMSTGFEITSIMGKNLDIITAYTFSVFFYYFFSSCKKALVSSKLGKSYSSHNISHIALEIWSHNIIFPGSKLCLCESILRLSVKRKKHKLMINLLIIHTRNVSPYQCTTLCCGKVLYCMERKAGKVRSFPAHLTLSAGTETMC